MSPIAMLANKGVGRKISRGRWATEKRTKK